MLRLGGGLTSLRLGSGEERVRTAYQLGREAAAILRGEASCFTSTGISGRRACYVVLFATGLSEPFITFDRAVYFR